MFEIVLGFELLDFEAVLNFFVEKPAMLEADFRGGAFEVNISPAVFRGQPVGVFESLVGRTNLRGEAQGDDRTEAG